MLVRASGFDSCRRNWQHIYEVLPNADTPTVRPGRMSLANVDIAMRASTSRQAQMDNSESSIQASACIFLPGSLYLPFCC